MRPENRDTGPDDIGIAADVTSRLVLRAGLPRPEPAENEVTASGEKGCRAPTRDEETAPRSRSGEHSFHLRARFPTTDTNVSPGFAMLGEYRIETTHELARNTRSTMAE